MNASRKRTSGEHPSVKAFRKKLDSIQGSIPALDSLNARIDKMKPKKPDPRREDDEEVPTDTVLLHEPDPFPTEKEEGNKP